MSWYQVGITNVKTWLMAYTSIPELEVRRRVRVIFDTVFSSKYHQVYVAYRFVTVSDQPGETTIDFWTNSNNTDVCIVAVDTADRLVDYSDEIFPTTPRRARRTFAWPVEGTAPWLNWLNFYGNNGTGTVDYSSSLNLLQALMSGPYGTDIPTGAEVEWISDPYTDGVYNFGVKTLDNAGNASTQLEDYCVFVMAYPDIPNNFQTGDYDSGSDLLTLTWSHNF